MNSYHKFPSKRPQHPLFVEVIYKNIPSIFPNLQFNLPQKGRLRNKMNFIHFNVKIKKVFFHPFFQDTL